MHIIIKDKNTNKTHQMKAFTHQYIEDIKGMINQLIGVPIEQQTLT